MDNLEHLISMNMLLVTLRMAIPLILASIGSVICERSGIINLGIEGMMLAGALGAVIGTSVFQSPWKENQSYLKSLQESMHSQSV